MPSCSHVLYHDRSRSIRFFFVTLPFLTYLTNMVNFISNDYHCTSGISPIGRKSMLKLAQRMTYNFCSGVCASSVRKWDKLCVGNVGEDVRVLTRKNVNDPGEPPGVVLCAATTVWLPMTRQRLFDFMRDERMRSEWDILSNGGPLQEMVHIAKGQAPGNCVSLLRAGVSGHQLILSNHRLMIINLI